MSLHAPDDALRDRIVPINRKHPIAELLAACKRYLPYAPRDFVTFEYVMLDGVNDRREHAHALARIAREVPCKINLIPFNPFPGTEFRSSPRERIRAFQQVLKDAGVTTTVRKTRGDDIDAACGQLAGQVQDRVKRRLATRIVALTRRRSPRIARTTEVLRMRNALPVVLAALVSSPAASRTRSRLPPAQPAGAARPADPAGAAGPAAAGSGDGRQRAEIHTELAAGYYERAQMNVALEELAIAEKFDPTYPRIYNLYGLVYAVMGELPRAEAQFKRALELAPNDAETRHNWGWYLCTHGRERESIAEFEVAIRNPLYRTPEIALVNAGKCSAAIGEVAAADQYFRRALQMRPNDPAAAYNLALLSLPGRAPPRVASADEDRAAADVVAGGRGAVSRHVHRAQARRPSVRAIVRRTASQPLPGFRRGARHRRRHVRMSLAH